MRRLRARQEWGFFGALFKASPGLATAVVGRARCSRGLLPALLGDRVRRADRRGAARRLAGRPADVRRDRVRRVPGAHPAPPGGQLQPREPHRGLALRPPDGGVRRPPGMGHLERPELDERPHDGARLRPRHHRPAAVDRHGLHRERARRDGRRASAPAIVLVAVRVVGADRARRVAWASTHWLLRESAVWRDRNTDEVRNAQRHADYAYRLAVDAPAAKELRLFGLAAWVVERFAARRRRLYELQWRGDAAARASGDRLPRDRARRQRRRVLGARRRGVERHASSLGAVVVYLQTAIGTERDRVRRPELGARRRRRAGCRDAPARGGDGAGRRARRTARARAADGDAGARDPVPRRHLRLRDERAAGARRLRPHDPGRHVDGDRRPERRRARRRSRSCCAASTTRSRARSRSTASTSATSSSPSGARASPPCSRTSSASSCPLRANVAPRGAPDADDRGARSRDAGARRSRRPRHDPRPRLRGRHRPLGRAVAAGRAGARAVRGAARRRRRAARRADRAARRARRGRDLRAHPRRDARTARRS